MPPEPQSLGQALKTFFVSAVQIVLYVPLLVLRIAARLLLLAATVLPVAMPFIVGGFLLEWWQQYDIGTWVADYLQGNHALVTGLAYFVAVGLFANYLKDIVSKFWAAVRGVLQPIRDVFLGTDGTDGNNAVSALRAWVPFAEVGASLAGTWHDNIAKIPHNLKLSAGRNAWLTVVAAVAAAVVAVTIPFVLRDTKVDRYVWVATAEQRSDAAQQAPDDQQEPDVPEVDTDGDEPPPETPASTPPANGDTSANGNAGELEAHLRNGTVFSLTHLKDAQPSDGEGICLSDTQKAWLGEFKDAIAACVKAEGGNQPGAEVRRFDVKAFASIAPVESSAFTSAELNCEIANRRADAVGAFLAYEGVSGQEDAHKKKWECGSFGDDFASVNDVCAASASDGPFQDYTGVHNGTTYEVRVHRWRRPADMEDGKPADDGALPSERRYSAEMFNRSVHITVPRGFCRPTKSEG